MADYSASTKSRTTNIGGPNKLYGVLTDKEGEPAGGRCGAEGGRTGAPASLPLRPGTKMEEGRDIAFI